MNEINLPEEIMYKQVGSFSELQELLSVWKKEKLKYSNFFPNQTNNQKWIGEKALFVSEYTTSNGKIGLLFHFRKAVCEVYYFATEPISFNNMMSDSKLKASLIKRCGMPLVVENIVKGTSRQSDTIVPQRVLVRLSHRNKPGEAPKIECQDTKVVVLSEFDVDRLVLVKGILNKDFSPLTDRIPDLSELKELAKNGGVVGDFRRDENGNQWCAGFVVFELSGQSIHLRYWWVAKEVRGQRIGASLLSKFFEVGKNTLLQYLWVDITNENAIKRYNHYGFMPDGLQDKMYIIK